MYDLHIANKNYSSWSLRPWVLMRHLGIPFEEHVHPFGEGSNWERFKAFSPTGKVPCLHAEGDVIWDSLGMAEYLAEHHAGVWPHEARARAWARCASAEMHSGFATLREMCSMNCGLRVKLHEITPALKADLDRLQALWSEGLDGFGGPFLAGDRFTAVDAFFTPVAFRVQSYGLVLAPHLQAYVDTLLALPAMRRWYEQALHEPWREPGHEAACLLYGTQRADLRTKSA